MPGKGHSPEQVLNKLRQVEVAVAGGKSVGQAVRGIDLPPIPVPLAMLVRRPVSA